MDVSETNAACYLKVVRCKQLIDLMKVCEYSIEQVKVIFFYLGSRSFTYEN